MKTNWRVDCLQLASEIGVIWACTGVSWACNCSVHTSGNARQFLISSLCINKLGRWASFQNGCQPRKCFCNHGNLVGVQTRCMSDGQVIMQLSSLKKLVGKRRLVGKTWHTTHRLRLVVHQVTDRLTAPPLFLVHTSFHCSVRSGRTPFLTSTTAK